jgi:hypothetical protein
VYRYRCEQCRTTSPSVRTRREAETERDRHRTLAHAGHIPDGEQIKGPPEPEQPPFLATPARRAITLTVLIVAFAIYNWFRYLA